MTDRYYSIRRDRSRESTEDKNFLFNVLFFLTAVFK